MNTITKTGCYWFCYKHTNGSIHPKRYFNQEDITEANASPFVLEVRGPIEGTREDAEKLFKEE